VDRSGPAARAVLEAASCTVVENAIAPDEIDAIQAVVRRWAALDGIDWIVTTGGTGFGARDRTPEVRPHAPTALSN
jgi:molybdopterin biosynthesis enzyme MoaB